MVAQPVISFESELLTSISAFWAPSSPLSGALATPTSRSSHRQHQILLAGTSDGQLKRIALLDNKQQQQQHSGIRAIELDSSQLSDARDHSEPILPRMLLLPQDPDPGHALSALVATPSKLVKLRVNGCRARTPLQHNNGSSSHTHNLADSCNACASLEDPLCGWCSSSASCSTRHACAAAAPKAAAGHAPHWQPFDQIRCSDYEPISPGWVALQSEAAISIEVNVPLKFNNNQAQHSSTNSNNQTTTSADFGHQLAQAQFNCHFDYLGIQSNKSQLLLAASKNNNNQVVLSSQTKATQARLNLHSSTVSIGCPLPTPAHRPSSAAGQEVLPVRLLVRLDPGSGSFASGGQQQQLEHALGMTPNGSGANNNQQLTDADQLELMRPPPAQIERTLTLFDCSAHSSCRGCAGSSFGCAWCPLTDRCTFNSSHPELGCAASALLGPASQLLPATSSTPPSALRASQLASALTPGQASLFGRSIDRLAQCPGANGANDNHNPSPVARNHHQVSTIAESSVVAAKPPHTPTQANQHHATTPPQASEILIAHQSRRSVMLPLKASALQAIVGAGQLAKRAGAQLKIECLFELEQEARARVGAKLLQSAPPESPHNPVVICQEMQFAYDEESALQRAQVHVIVNENQLVDSNQGE